MWLAYQTAKVSGEVSWCENDVEWRRRRDGLDINSLFLSAVKQQGDVKAHLQTGTVDDATYEVVVGVVAVDWTNELRSRYVSRYVTWNTSTVKDIPLQYFDNLVHEFYRNRTQFHKKMLYGIIALKYEANNTSNRHNTAMQHRFYFDFEEMSEVVSNL